jgi:hypothetical protein
MPTEEEQSHEQNRFRGRGARAVAEAFGCKFDAKGDPTACRVAEVDDKNDDIIIATASK